MTEHSKAQVANAREEQQMSNENETQTEAVTTPRTTHELKTWTDFFQAIVDGRKNFEVRYNDRGFQAGDYVRLIEVDSRYTSRRTGRIIDARIGYVLSQPVGRAGASLDGFVVFSLLNIKEGRL